MKYFSISGGEKLFLRGNVFYDFVPRLALTKKCYQAAGQCELSWRIQRNCAGVELSVLRIIQIALPLIGGGLRRVAQDQRRGRSVRQGNDPPRAKISLAIEKLELLLVSAANPDSVNRVLRVRCGKAGENKSRERPSQTSSHGISSYHEINREPRF
jgi:hypothetical protein